MIQSRRLTRRSESGHRALGRHPPVGRVDELGRLVKMKRQPIPTFEVFAQEFVRKYWETRSLALLAVLEPILITDLNAV